MNTILKYFAIALLALPLGAKAQCDLPPQYVGNTGTNMTVMITATAINSLPITNENAYLVAFTPEGLLVGSSGVYGLAQGSLAVWGNDSFTTDIDGALEGEYISVQLVDGNTLYDLDIEINFIANSIVPLLSPIPSAFVCEAESTECILPTLYEGNTGSNMTVMLLPDFISSLNVDNDDAYIVAFDGDLVVGSVIFNNGTSDDLSTGQGTIAIWGDDSSTPENDGAQAGAEISFQLVDNNVLYELSTMSSISYTTGATIPILGEASINQVCEGEILGISGCMYDIACNYNVEATTDDGSCAYADMYYDCEGTCINDSDGDGVCDELEVDGCTDEAAFNYNEIATEDNGSCIEVVEGCMDMDAFNYNSNANTNDGSCYAIVYGCLDLNAFNYNDYDLDGEANASTGINGVDVNTSDGSCIAVIEGCMEAWADNYNASANTSDDSCYKMGCLSDWADNYDANATIDDGSCYREGCTSAWAENFDELATQDDGTCYLNGCTSNWADNYNINATINDGSCFKNGCTDQNADNYDTFATLDDASCLYTGCMTEAACNYTAYYNVHDVSMCDFPMQYYNCNGACIEDTDSDGVCDELEVLGCQQVNANNYNPLATDPAFCVYYGCMEAQADNYNPNANTSDNSCYYLGCMNADALNFDGSATVHDENQCVFNVADFGCELPDSYSGLVTGSNMNILLTTQFTEQIAIVNSDAYIVGLTPSNSIVGSAPISQGEMTSITLWGDDVQTDEIDGAISWEQINLFVVDGTNFYSVSLENNINYSENQTMVLYDLDQIQTLCMNGYYTLIPVFGCLDPLASNYIEPIGDSSVDVNTEDGTCLYNNQSNCVFPEVYNGNITGNNMNILFTQDFMNSLPNLQEGAFIVAVNNENTSFGSVAVFGTNMISLTIWGDDTGTISVDGAIESEQLHLYLVNGSNLYDINPYESNAYTNNGMQIYEQAASVLSLCSNGMIVHLEGCADVLASNYNPSATDDDGSCVFEGCTYNQFYEYSEQVSIEDGSCENLIVYGCTDSLYVEFNPLATENDGSCVYTIERIQELELTEASYGAIVLAYSILEQQVAPIPVDLYMGWNIIGYNLTIPQNTAACFEPIAENIVLAKNNGGYIYWPAYGFNGIGDLIPGQGYQIYMEHEVNDFSFVDVGGMRVELNPIVPQWAVDLAVEHPNDIKTLVRVINMLGQEVDLESQHPGTILLYLYNDGSVTKKILP